MRLRNAFSESQSTRTVRNVSCQENVLRKTQCVPREVLTDETVAGIACQGCGAGAGANRLQHCDVVFGEEDECDGQIFDLHVTG